MHIYHGIYHNLYHHIYHGIYHDIYHGIYYGIYHAPVEAIMQLIASLSSTASMSSTNSCPPQLHCPLQDSFTVLHRQLVRCIIVVIPVPIAAICPILLCITVSTVLRNGWEHKLASLCSMTTWKWQQLCTIQPRQKCYRCFIPWYISKKQVYTMVYTIKTGIYHGI